MKWDQRFLELAKHVSSWSKDPSTQVGAVLTDVDNRVISLGFNGFPRGVADLPDRYEDRELKYKYVVHAEINAILFAGNIPNNSRLYTWPFMPCERCAAQIAQTNILDVISIQNDNPRWQESFKVAKQIFKESGKEVHLYDEDFLNA